MCGFAGFINLSGLQGQPGDRRRVLDDMVSRIAHRGPDDESFYDDGTLALGFRRLSIVDIAGGRQPFWNQDRSILSVVNGEIYNHQALRSKLANSYAFRSRSDSEVILPLYQDHGAGWLDEVNGIFAIAIWDLSKRRLVLARDRLGVKPLYYSVSGDTLLFGSELKALLAHPACPREVNWRQVSRGNAVHQPVTPSYVHGVKHLPAGHTLVFEAGKPVRPVPYWSLDKFFAEAEDSPRHTPAHYIDRYGELLDDSIRQQLMSDVPLGLFLSGGIDSSLIAAAVSAERPNMHCFTIAEKTTEMTGDLGLARTVSTDLSLPLHAVQFNGPAMLDELEFDLEYLEHLAWCSDSPRFEIEWFFKHELFRYAKTHSPDLKVVLTGTGADEFAGGYSSTYRTPGRSWQAYLDGHVRGRWDFFRSIEDGMAEERQDMASLHRARSIRSGYQHMMYMNLSSLQVYNLWYEDRMSAAYGIEARVPFLDHRLVELLASVPLAYHEQLFWNKQIIRKQLGRLMPGYPADFPKVPFVYVQGNDSVQALKTNALKRTFHQFLDKYVKPGDPLLPRVALKQLYQQATSASEAHSPDAKKAEYRLFQVMQTAIFRDSCQGGWRNPPSIPEFSPLKENN